MLVVQYQLRRYLLGTCTKTRKNACTEHGTRERRINHGRRLIFVPPEYRMRGFLLIGYEK